MLVRGKFQHSYFNFKTLLLLYFQPYYYVQGPVTQEMAETTQEETTTQEATTSSKTNQSDVSDNTGQTVGITLAVLFGLGILVVLPGVFIAYIYLLCYFFKNHPFPATRSKAFHLHEDCE